MKRKLLRCAGFSLLLTLLFTPLCWAKSNGYFYITAYSLTGQKAFISPVFTQKVKSKSYSDEEYVTEVGLIRKMESQFQNHISQFANLNSGQYTISVRGAYKSETIAKSKYNDELELYKTKGYTIKHVSDFKFSD